MKYIPLINYVYTLESMTTANISTSFMFLFFFPKITCNSSDSFKPKVKMNSFRFYGFE